MFTNESKAKAFYEEHNATVRATVPKGQLLEYHAGEGWEPLCEALGVPVPGNLFPHANTTKDFQNQREGRTSE